MASADLTNLAKVQGWLTSGPQNATPPEAAETRRLISAASKWAQSNLSINIAPQLYSIRRNGDGRSEMWLPNRPILAISSLTIDGSSVTAASGQGDGYLFDDNAITLRGWLFTKGIQNVEVTWTSGYQAGPEAAVIPTDGTPLSVLTLDKPWISNVQVSFAADGTILTATVDKNPSAGTYRLDVSGPCPIYQFSEADKGQPINITYGFCPADIEQGVIEIVGQAAMRRTRIGVSSKTFANVGADVFSTKDMDETTRGAFNQFRNVIPV